MVVIGQRKLVKSSVLLVGGGGLASSAALYLAGAGVGRIGIVDFDDIEISNLQRQIIHKEALKGTSKAVSAVKAIKSFNSQVETFAYETQFTSANALEIAKPYDVVLDCTDNVTSRYLINDVCVLLNKPLVSGSALRMEGQVTVYHLNTPTTTALNTPNSNDNSSLLDNSSVLDNSKKLLDNSNFSPCYRCMFPEPPPKAAQGNCNNEGVLGVVPGIIGCIQALEAIKILAQTGNPLAGRMIMFDANNSTFRNFRLRSRNKNCAICGDHPTIKELIDYERFCNASANDKAVPLKLLLPEQTIPIKQYADTIYNTKPHILIDVRPALQFDICALPNAVNIPLSEFETQVNHITTLAASGDPIYTICRRGNDSQRAVLKLQALGITNVLNVQGGVAAWTTQIDHDFPIY